jgi:hypothetical protein
LLNLKVFACIYKYKYFEMGSKKLLNEISYTKSLMGINENLILEYSKQDLPKEIVKRLDNIERLSGYKYKITDENIDFEYRNEGGPSVDGGGDNLTARGKVEEMTKKMVELFPELNGMTRIVSGYRGYDKQVEGFLKHLDRDGSVLGRQKWVALPGFSQHHTGLAFDIFSVDPSWWDQRPTIKKWVADNVAKYGLKLSYPVERGPGYRGAEPWHLFYIGGGKDDTSNTNVNQGSAQQETNSLKSLLSSLGYVYKSTMDEAGPLDAKFASILKSVAKKLKEELPEYTFRFGAGHDNWHKKVNTGSRHNKGRAVDVTLVGKYPKKEDLNKISTVLCAARQKFQGFTFIDEYTCPSAHSTGGHYHFSYQIPASDESRCTAPFCSSSASIVKMSNTTFEEPDEIEVEDTISSETSDVKQPDKIEKILDTIGLSKLAKMDLDKDGKQFSKEVIDLFGGDEKDVKETDDGDFKIFGYTLSDIIDKAKKLFEHRLNEDINKMKKPLK